MEYLNLKNSDLVVSRLCMGGCPMGGYGWGIVREDELIDTVHAALDNGITFFDTADIYGLGQSEITLGKALKNKRQDVVIASKFGVRMEKDKTTYDNSPQWIREALSFSLKRLQTDYIDLYQLHYRDNVTPIEAVIDVLEDLKKEGYIRYYGLSNVYKKDKEELKPYKGKFVSFQNQYSLACRDYESDILEIAEELQMTPMTWGSLGQGILTGKYDKTAVFGTNDRRSREVYVNFHGEKLLKNLQIVEALKQMVSKRNKSAAGGAIRFILDFLPESVVLAGMKRPAQLFSNLEAMDWHYEKSEMQMLLDISRDNSCCL